MNHPAAFSAALPDAPRVLDFLRTQCAALHRDGVVRRPWHYSELHNPWSRAAEIHDAWGFLDLCQMPEIIALVTPLIGPDIILYDSQLAPDPWPAPPQEDTPDDAWQCDAERCPVAPLAGAVVRIAFDRPGGAGAGAAHFICHQAPRKPLAHEPGRVIVHDIRQAYRIAAAAPAARPFEFILRLFPATSRYSRDPATPVHRALCERYPLVNYARMPLWLVSGEDRADNDFVTGFASRPGRWATPPG